MGYHAFALDRVEAEHEHLTGRRVVHLALARRKGFAVPDGFVVLRKTFGDLVRDTALKLTLPALEKRLVARSATMEQLAAEVAQLVMGVAVPRHIMLDVESGCHGLGLGNRSLGRSVTIRACPVDERLSSAPLERAVAVTRLSDVEGKLKACWASAFDAANLEAVRHFAMSFEDAAPSVLISQTLPCEVSGLLFSHAPGEPGAMLIEAVWGFHEALTEGRFHPSRYLVERGGTGQVRAQESDQRWEYAQGPQGAMVRREVPADRAGRAKLSRLQTEELARACAELEALVGGPVGVEWAIQGGVVFVLQVVPLGEPAPPPSEAEHAERYVREVEAREAQVLARKAPAPAEAPPLPAAAPPREAPQPQAAARSRAAPVRLLPVIETSLFVELPAGSQAQQAAFVPHAGLVIDLAGWARSEPERVAFPARLAQAAAAVFPRPVLVELTDLDPALYEQLHERAGSAAPLTDRDLEQVLGPALEELELVVQAADEVGATNIHVIAPFIKAAQDAAVMRRALAAVGLGGQGAPRTLLFSELRNPSTLLYNADFAAAQDGIIVRASRFYNALMRQDEGPAPAPGAEPERAGPPSQPLVHALFAVTRAFEAAGGSVLVHLEAPSDFDTVWFFRDLGVDGFIARLEDAEGCARALSDLETRRPSRKGARRGARP